MIAENMFKLNINPNLIVFLFHDKSLCWMVAIYVMVIGDIQDGLHHAQVED